MSTTVTATMAPPAPVQSIKQQVAQQAVAAQPVSPSTASQELLSPSLEAILTAFKQQGGNDSEMLKLLLQAKVKEDERLAALDLLRAEQLRAASIIAQQQHYYLYASQAALVAAQQAKLTGPAPPYSPTSPPSSVSGYLAVPQTGKRPRATSDASSVASTSSSSHSESHKRAKTSSKPTHEDVMAALRRKCESNQYPQQPTPSPSSYTVPLPAGPPPSSYYPHAPSSASAATAALTCRRTPSLSPPLGPPAPSTTVRRNSPPHIPGRHTAFLRPAAPLPTATNPVAPHSPPLSVVREEEKQPQQPARNNLALLLHASESAAAAAVAVGDWQPPKPSVVQATSDVRGEA